MNDYSKYEETRSENVKLLGDLEYADAFIAIQSKRLLDMAKRLAAMKNKLDEAEAQSAKDDVYCTVGSAYYKYMGRKYVGSVPKEARYNGRLMPVSQLYQVIHGHAAAEGWSRGDHHIYGNLKAQYQECALLDHMEDNVTK